MSETRERTSLALTEACWPVFEFITNFTRQVQYGSTPPPEQVRYEALSALRDAEDLARNDPSTERLWETHARAMMVYFIDYKMLNTEWAGRNYWFDNMFETDSSLLSHAEALGGEEFFRGCDDLQREYELAERRDRRDKHELAEILSLYFVCLRLGFKGQFHDRPQELADYTRRLFARLPAYATTRGREMFPEVYKHVQEVKVNYNLGLSLTIVLTTFVLILGAWLVTSRVVWHGAVKEIAESAATFQAAPAASDGGAQTSTAGRS